MKKFIIILGVLVAVTFGCFNKSNNKIKQKQEIARPELPLEKKYIQGKIIYQWTSSIEYGDSIEVYSNDSILVKKIIKKTGSEVEYKYGDYNSTVHTLIFIKENGEKDSLMFDEKPKLKN